MAETVGKLKRSALAHYLDSTFGGETPVWFIIGQDVEDMSIELNPNLETKTNILDETAVDDNGYEPSTEVDTYYANPNDGEFYEKLKDIAMNRQTGEACRTTILEVLIDKTAAPFDAWTEDVIIKPQSYGGATGGVRIPYSITFCGNRRQGTVTITDRVPVFTETAAE